MNWQDFGAALCLMLVFEGMMPFLNPERWQRLMSQLAATHASQLRLMGLISMSLGLLGLYWVR